MSDQNGQPKSKPSSAPTISPTRKRAINFMFPFAVGLMTGYLGGWWYYASTLDERDAVIASQQNAMAAVRDELNRVRKELEEARKPRPRPELPPVLWVPGFRQ